MGTDALPGIPRFSMVLDDVLAKLNSVVKKNNQEVDEAVESGELEEVDAPSWKVPQATAEMVRQNSYPMEFHKVVGKQLVSEDPGEVVRLAGLVRAANGQTATTKAIGFGAKNSKGVYPILIRALDLAHLLSRAHLLGIDR